MSSHTQHEQTSIDDQLQDEFICTFYSYITCRKTKEREKKKRKKADPQNMKIREL